MNLLFVSSALQAINARLIRSNEMNELNWQLCVQTNKGNLNNVDRLLSEGANINVMVQYGIDGDDDQIWNCGCHTPLHIASMHGNYNLIVLLLRHGANLNAKNSYGNAPETVAINPKIKNLFKRCKTAHQEMTAFLMANHQRCGEVSPAHVLPQEIYQYIYNFLRTMQ